MYRRGIRHGLQTEQQFAGYILLAWVAGARMSVPDPEWIDEVLRDAHRTAADRFAAIFARADALRQARAVSFFSDLWDDIVQLFSPTPPASAVVGCTHCPLTPAQAQAWFDHFKARTDIPWNYPNDCCYNRAVVMDQEMTAAGVDAGKVWNYAPDPTHPLSVPTSNDPDGHVEWGYHVAPTVPVMVNGNVTPMVLDPSIAAGPVTPQQWKDLQNQPASSLALTNAAPYYRTVDGRVAPTPQPGLELRRFGSPRRRAELETPTTSSACARSPFFWTTLDDSHSGRQPPPGRPDDGSLFRDGVDRVVGRTPGCGVAAGACRRHAVSDYNHGTPGLCGGGILANEFIRLPIQMVDRMPTGTPCWGLAHKHAMRACFKRNIVVMGPTQQIPTADARVTLDPSVRDKWGIPVARISGNVHPHTFEIGLMQAKRAEAWLKEAGAVSTLINAGQPKTVSAGQHQAGTCRMGNDPRASVVNRNCQLHDVDNVFVIDSSVHVNNGGFNPALTIMAIAYYASQALDRNWKGTGFRS